MFIGGILSKIFKKAQMKCLATMGGMLKRSLAIEE
ncbi:unknown protein [Simkania negevensis Z]|uniref:Uncharacterized protein n=1 Tax=Simkania negevensis (strain ATCC VR-1471 / DSM 27360 / Z) TaxID=331113 RepID=F8L9F0_SIMNZ|nr:unknown protein [Simkania negevensis Z]